MTSNKKPTTTAKFPLNEFVRVRSGVTDPDFPDTPLGGWAGKIVEVQSGDLPTYLIRWNQSTLAGIHPIYRKRCEPDGFAFDTCDTILPPLRPILPTLSRIWNC